MKLHYKGKYDAKKDTLPIREHMPGAVKFKEVEDAKQMGILGNVIALIITAIFVLIVYARSNEYMSEQNDWQICLGTALALICLFPHEFLHAICFKEDVYLYTNFKNGLVFVVGTEDMSKARFIFMSLLPSLIFGLIPFIIGMACPKLIIISFWGAVSLGMGAGDYYNIFNAVTQMPKGARTYLCGFNSYWYIPEEGK